MLDRDRFIQRLGEVELERAELLEEMDRCKDRLAVLDKEYAALKALLTSNLGDRRWAALGPPLAEAVYRLVSQAGEPLHYKEIYRRLRNEQVHVGGSAALSNLLVRLNRDQRFVKMAPGVYGLREWEGPQPGEEENTGVNLSVEGDERRVISREREAERLRFVLESLNIDIQVTQANLRVLRDKMLGTADGDGLPESLDPLSALPSLERRLMRLLEQRNDLNERLDHLLRLDAEE